jgi:hypothetical protein
MTESKRTGAIKTQELDCQLPIANCQLPIANFVVISTTQTLQCLGLNKSAIGNWQSAMQQIQ